MKKEKGYFQNKMRGPEYRAMRCLAAYLYYHDRRDLLWMHYSSKLRKGDLESCEALLVAFAQLKDREDQMQDAAGSYDEATEIELSDLIPV